MKLLTGLFRMARKRSQTKDNDLGMFREKIVDLVEKKDSLSDEDIAKKVEELKGLIVDLPDGDDKAKLDRFLEDFKAVKEQDSATAKEAASMIADLFEKLDTEAMKDVPAAEKVVEETKEKTVADEDEKKPAEEDKKSVADEEEKTLADYTFEELYQLLKKRMAEDEDCKEETVTDCAPRVAVTMNDNTAKGSLAEMLNNFMR